MSGNWSKYRLDEIAKLSMGQSPQSKFYNTDGDGLPFFQGKTEFGEYYPSVRQFTSKTTKKAVEGDVLFTVRAPVGELNIANQDCCIGRGLAAIQAKNENENRFLYYILKVNTELFLSRSSGAVYDAISGGDLKSSEIFIPNNSQERIKIAKILSNYDDLIENNLKRIKLLEESARLTYEEWFLRFRIDGKNLDIDPTTDLPFGWSNKSFNSICKKISSGGTPSRANKKYWDFDDYDWVTTKELRDGYIYDTKEKISLLGLEKSSAKLFPKGTIVMAIYASPTLGRLGVITKESCFNQAAVGFIIDENFISNEFLYCKLISERVGLNALAMGAAQQNINLAKVKNYEVVIPDLELLQEFTNVTRPMFNEIENLGLQNQLLKEARDILLPRLMTGMIDTDDMDIAV